MTYQLESGELLLIQTIGELSLSIPGDSLTLN